MPTSTSQFSLPLLVRFSSVALALSGSASLRASGSLRSAELDGARRLHLLLRAVADEDRLAAPQHGDGLPGLDRREVDLDGGQRLRGGVRVHLVDEGPQGDGGAHGGKGLCRNDDEVAPVGLFRGMRRQVSLPLHTFARARRSDGERDGDHAGTTPAHSLRLSADVPCLRRRLPRGTGRLSMTGPRPPTGRIDARSFCIPLRVAQGCSGGARAGNLAHGTGVRPSSRVETA